MASFRRRWPRSSAVPPVGSPCAGSARSTTGRTPIEAVRGIVLSSRTARGRALAQLDPAEDARKSGRLRVNRLTLREVRDEDLPLLFEQWADPVAVHMAAFTAPDHMDWDAFERRWSRLRADDSVLARVIVVDDDVAGTIGS